MARDDSARLMTKPQTALRQVMQRKWIDVYNSPIGVHCNGNFIIVEH
jgi:hypothetical protein